MREVKLKQVQRDHVEVLQQELSEFAEWQRLGFNYWSAEDFFNALLTVDIAVRLFFALRKKVESEKTSCTLSLKVSEAVIILKCCTWQRSARTEYQAFIAEKYKGLIDQQLKSIVTN